LAGLQHALATRPKVCYICACLRTDGCFVPETKILLADGSSRAIEDLSAGERVWNPVSKRPARIKFIRQGGENKPLIKIAYGNDRLTVTDQHPVLTAAGLKQAGLLTKDDIILDGEGREHPLSVLEKVLPVEGQQVINIMLEGPTDSVEDHYVVADGIITGDLLLQVRLAADPAGTGDEGQ
jgi:hypothetical protein